MTINKKRIKQFCVRILSVFLIFGLFLNISLTCTVRYVSPQEGTITLHYVNTKKPDQQLAVYDTHLSWKTLNQDEESVIFNNIPLLTNDIEISFDAMDTISIKSIELSIGSFVVKEYTPEEIYTSIVSYEGIRIPQLSGEALKLYIESSDNASIQLVSEEYIQFGFWLLIFGTLLFLSLIPTCMFSFIFKNNSEAADRELVLLAMPALIYILMESVSYNYWFISVSDRILNYAFLYLAYRCVYLVLFHRPIAILVCNFFAFVYAETNYYLVLFRGKPLLPFDLYAVKTAFSVADSYNFEITAVTVFFFLTCLGGYLYFRRVCKYEKLCYIYMPLQKVACEVGFIIVTASVLFLTPMYKTLKAYYWDSDILYLYKIQGQISSYIKYTEVSRVSKPDDYDSATLYQEISDYVKGNTQSTTDNLTVPQNIIMIMNESFADISIINETLHSDLKSVMPYYNDLTENTIKGNLYVSVRGGSTCNTEFETLTGDSLIFLPPGAIPFQMYLHRKTPSIASFLELNGYSVSSIHPQNPDNWNRAKVYPYLSLEPFYSIENLDDVQTIHNYPSDLTCYNEIIRLYENREPDKKFFNFTVTVQNHGGYSDFDDMEQLISIEDYDAKDAEVYLSLIKESDDALKKIIEYFQQVDENTMIIFYGDHQPSLSSQTEAWLSGDSGSRNLSRYITPFMIWTNYDIEERYIDKISANYLSSLVMETANIELPIYNQFLMRLFEIYPVLTTQGIIDSNNRFFPDVEQVIKNNSDLQLYQKIQYNSLFDSNIQFDIFQ